MHPLIAAGLTTILERDRIATAAARRSAVRSGHEGNDHEGNGHEGNGHEGNGHEGNGHEGNGHEGNGHVQSAGGEVVIRRARAGDARALRRLGHLDSDPATGRRLADAAADGDVLVAETERGIVAARSLTGSAAVADPFRPTAVHSELLALRAEQMGAPARPHHPRLATLRPRLH